METSNAGLQMIEGFEAYRGYPYKDIAGWWTWGYGHKRVGNEPMPTFISQPDAVALLRRDIAQYETAVNDNVKYPITQDQFDALVDFTYNLGVADFESSTLLKLLNSGDIAGAANEFPKWDHARVNGQEVEVPGLLARRMQERTLFLRTTAAVPPASAPAPAAAPAPASSQQSVWGNIKGWLGL